MTSQPLFGTTKQWLRGLLMALALLVLLPQAHAVVTVVGGYTGVRTLTMRVGTPTAGVIDTVQFNVINPSTGNSIATAASVNGDGTAIAASTGGVFINMNMRVPAGNITQTFSMTVTSPATLTCLSGGCGAATIPFSAISWTMAVTPSGTNSAFDFQSGTFAAGTTQSMNTFAIGVTTLGFAATVDFSGTMNFRYANTTAFPAGTYSGTVIYTATLL
jgi:hypothetical protein